MIPNLDQLLLVCGVSLVGVAVIIWLMLKISDNSNDKDGEHEGDD